MHLAAALEDVHALLLRLDRIAVEVGGALLELGEVLDALHRALRAEQALDVHAAQRRRVDPVAVLVRADVADRVGRRIGVAVGVAVEARDALVRGERAAIVRGVELRLRERRQEQPQSFELLGIQDLAEQLVEVRERDELALRHVAEIGPRGQEDRRGKLGQQVIGRSKSRSKRVRSRSVCFLISSICFFGNTMPPASWCGCGSG